MSHPFGEKLRYLRLQQDQTQSDLARQIAAKRAHINNLEAGRRTPSLDLVLRLAEVFGVMTDYLLRDTIPVDMATSYPITRLSASEPASRLFGRKLRYLRERHQMTQAAVAIQLGLSANAHISFLEAGLKEPSLELVVRIADLFGVTTDYLLRDAVPMVPTSSHNDTDANPQISP
jgi:transcriptional regulator with XRE-family HTH domain